ncbi:hypothetical protein H8K90_07095 [Winogradskyella echinorum]|uniref:Uncharacterized protein n=1 Tax=Winogradskyella echinorum TaxID=538189 RepID=A0ABR6Y084_9FLAO|nr:hypothetical protein [Winogradskyella echinorum]MBC3846137.1 hypothetical protein [Winogradskyella echinorum]MBC5750485.1 hypothetical protein [Winogradskyella echinorum]
MKKTSNTKRNIVLGILFFLPVAFLLMLYPAKHNYEPLNVVNLTVADIDNFYSDRTDSIVFKDHITVLGFLGKTPLQNAIAASNLKELVYDKFKGFKKFQIVIVVPEGTEDDVKELKKEINTYEDLKFWHYVFGTEGEIKMLYNSLKTQENLKQDLSTDNVFIIDKDLSQRGRIDGRDEKEIEANKPTFSVYSYNTIQVAEIKNMMSDDMRILFTEYRQKRKGKFDDSNTRRTKDLKQTNE